MRFRLIFLSLLSLYSTSAVEINLPPLLAEPTVVFKAETFNEGKENGTWHFLEWWEARDGILLRNDLPGENKRIFIKKPEYKDVAIRFDFQFRVIEKFEGMGERLIMVRPEPPSGERYEGPHATRDSDVI